MFFLFYKNQNVVDIRKKLKNLNLAIEKVYINEKTEYLVSSYSILSLKSKVELLVSDRYLLESFVVKKKAQGNIECEKLIELISDFCWYGIGEILTEKNKNRRQFVEKTIESLLYLIVVVGLISLFLLLSFAIAVTALGSTDGSALMLAYDVSGAIFGGAVFAFLLVSGCGFFENHIYPQETHYAMSDIDALVGRQVQVTKIAEITRDKNYKKLITEFASIENAQKHSIFDSLLPQFK